MHPTSPLRLFVRWIGCLFILGLRLAANAAPVAEAQPPLLKFTAPTNNNTFSTRSEIPIVLRAFAPNDVFFTSDIFADEQKIATASFCCALCPCAQPQVGIETTLQIPVSWNNGIPPPRPWRGWTNAQAGSYRLTARAVGQNGSTVEAAPIFILVVDLSLEIFMRSDGGATLVIPQGSLVPGRYDLEVSPDLQTWTRLGAFQPGDVAAFYFDVPPEKTWARRYYRSVYLP